MTCRPMLRGLVLLALVSPACGAGDRALPPAYRDVAVPVTRLASPESRTRGGDLFLQHCALCHGERGDGNGERREGLASPPRNFTDPGWRQSTSPRRVYFAIREGLVGTPMPEWKSLSEGDAWDLTAYVLALSDR